MSTLRDDVSMTVEQFLAFTETRPDEERWDHIDGEPVLKPSPSYGHQKLGGNLYLALHRAEEAGVLWEVLPGLGAKLSPRSMPVPDVLVRPVERIDGHWCDDMIVAFEVLSPSSRSRDLNWKRQNYATLPSLQHYVVLQQSKVEVRSYDRSNGWTEARITDPQAVLRLYALGIALPLARLYAGTGLV
jgi:Uma2 family endonuclease